MFQIHCKEYNFTVDFSPSGDLLFYFAQGVNKSATLKRPLNRLSKTVEAYLGLLRNNTATQRDHFSSRLRPTLGVLPRRAVREHDFFMRAYWAGKTFGHE